jgi:hypothetical protein
VPVLQLFGHAPVHSQAAYALAYRGAALPLRDLREEVHPAGAHEATHVGECGGSAGAARAQCEACFGATLGWPGMGVMGGGHRVPWVPQKWGRALWRGRWNRESTSLDIIVVSAGGGGGPRPAAPGPTCRSKLAHYHLPTRWAPQYHLVPCHSPASGWSQSLPVSAPPRPLHPVQAQHLTGSHQVMGVEG